MIISIDWWFQHVSTHTFWKEARHRNGMILRDPFLFSRGLEPSKQSSEYVYITIFIYIYMICVWPPPIQDVGQRAGSEMAFGGTLEIPLLRPVVANIKCYLIGFMRFQPGYIKYHKVL